MKVALLGNGKTGSQVAKLCSSPDLTVFNRSNPITLEKLKGHDVIISFLPGDAFNQQIELLLSLRIPVVSGSTGDIDFESLDQNLKKQELSWVHGNNFSISMTAIRSALTALGSLQKIAGYEFSMKDVHHKLKKDAPSGTAKSWRQWLGIKDLSIESLREGDVVGIHNVLVKSEFESIELRHEAHDRRLFAQGAIWAAERVLAVESLPFGLISFQDLVAQALELKGEV